MRTNTLKQVLTVLVNARKHELLEVSDFVNEAEDLDCQEATNVLLRLEVVGLVVSGEVPGCSYVCRLASHV